MNRAWLRPIIDLPLAIRLAATDQRARLWGQASFLISLIFYLLALPATDTGGIIGLVSLRFLTCADAALALLMASLLGLTTPLGLYSMRIGVGGKTSTSLIGAILAVLPTLLCCSPVLPLIITTLASTLPIAATIGSPLQGFIATHEAWIYAIAVSVMGWGLYANARRALYCAC